MDNAHPQPQPRASAAAPPVGAAPPEPARILRALGDEHRYQARLLALLEKQVGLLNQKQSADLEVMHGVMRYMTQYPDRFHHPKEDLLFEKLVARDPEAAPQVEQLLKAHVDIPALGSALLAQIDLLRAGDAAADPNRLRKAAHAYIGTLRRHMDIESLHLFPQAQRALQPQDWEEVDQRMKPILDPVFGAEVGKDFESLRAAEAARPVAPGPGAIGSGLIEAAALIESVATLIAGAAQMRREFTAQQRDLLRANRELARGLFAAAPLNQHLKQVGRLCERNTELIGQFAVRSSQQWAQILRAAWQPYADDGPYAPKLLRPRRWRERQAQTP